MQPVLALVTVAGGAPLAIGQVSVSPEEGLDFADILAGENGLGQPFGQCPGWWCRRPRAEPPA